LATSVAQLGATMADMPPSNPSPATPK